MLLDNTRGNFKFVRGYGAPFSSGALASPGFEIVHGSFKPLARLADGYGIIESHMREAGRPINAVCGIELRIGAPLTPAGFDEFNRGYIERLTAWGVMVDGSNPVARTNVAPAASPVGEPSLYGFYYTVPAVGAARAGFVLAGVPEGASAGGGQREKGGGRGSCSRECPRSPRAKAARGKSSRPATSHSTGCDARAHAYSKS